NRPEDIQRCALLFSVAWKQDYRRDQHEQDERDSDEEDPSPTEMLGDDSREHESQDETAACHRCPDAQRSSTGPSLGQKEDDGCHCSWEGEGFAYSLKQPGCNKHREGFRETCHHRGCSENRGADQEKAASTKDVPQAATEHE